MELLTVIQQVFYSILGKIEKIITTAIGRLWSCMVFAFTWTITWIGETREILVYLVLAAALLDLFWGIASSIKLKTFVLSIGFTKTCIKLAVYLSILIIIALAEKALAEDWNLIFRLTTSVLIVAEGVSICGHILIIKPDVPVIRLLWKVLRSEIAKKLNIEVKDLDEYVSNNIKENKNGTKS
ncbi:phage holin family protein [Bacteroides reticulotermitis]|uniref:phage holin family protein n=1 Tax=Bacteroides reticulotermitis TaxID=1133319 RepID=UPI003A89C5FB